MKIYVSHSRAFNFDKELYKPIKESDLLKQHQFIFPHEESNKSFPVGQSLTNHNIDLVIAEVSYPSTGQGMELTWSDAKGVKIICFYKKGSEFSSSLKKVSEEFVEYKDSEDLIQNLSNLLL